MADTESPIIGGKFNLLVMGGNPEAIIGFSDDLVYGNEPFTPDYLKAIRLYDRVANYAKICLKHSGEVNPDNVERLRSSMREFSTQGDCGYHLVTHGMNTMLRTGKTIEKDVLDRGDHAFLVGCCKPMVNVADSDGPIAIGRVMQACDDRGLDKGVYLGIPPGIFPWKDYAKLANDQTYGQFFKNPIINW